MPRLPAKTASEGIPEWDASVDRVRDLVRSLRQTRDQLSSQAGDAQRELVRMSRMVTRAGRPYDELSVSLLRMSRDVDPTDLRLTQLTQELDGIDHDYRRIADNPFSRVAADEALGRAWGRTLTWRR